MKKVIALLLIAIIIGIPYIYAQPAKAFPFNKNLLITDSAFTNYNTMDVNDIQKFLEEHNSILSTYRQNGMSASEIIFNAAKKYRINPAVILTTLQKEEGLITEHSYNSYALNYAMGYHRPSSFIEQIYGGTKLLRDGYDYLAAKCGWEVGKPHKTEDNPKYIDNVVTPQNKATASLYLYTPYIGGYYTEKGTFVGGNYNFVKIFLRWFSKELSDPVYPEFKLKKLTFYIPQNTASKIPLTLVNTTNTKINGSFSVVAKETIPALNIKNTKIETEIPEGKSVNITVNIPPLNEKEQIIFGIVDKNGKFVGNTCTVSIEPVHIDFYFTNSKNATTFNIVSTDAYIKYAYMDILQDIGDTPAKITLLNGDSLTKQELKQIEVQDSFHLNNFSVSFIGSDSKISRPPISIFLSNLSVSSPLISISAKSGNPAVIEIDNQYYLDTPAKINLPKGIHTIRFFYNQKTFQCAFNLLWEESFIFNLDSSDYNPPNIVLYNNSIVSAETNQIKLSGKVSDQSKIDSLTINNGIIPINENGEFETEVELKNIVNTFLISAMDECGNVNTISYKIIKEVDMPQIFTNTIPNITTNEFLKLNINTKNVCALYINNIPCTTPEKCIEFVRLKPGKNIITIVGKNKFGLSVEKNFTIVYSPLPKTQLLLKIGSKDLYINGTRKLMDVPPIIMWDRTLLPIRHIIEALHGNVEWNPKNRIVNIKISGAEISLKIGSNTALVNGREVQIDKNPSVVAIIKNNRTYIPLRFVIEQIGGKVTWFPKTREIEIVFPNY